MGPEGQTEKLRPYVGDIPINLRGRNLSKHWGTQINIPAIPETAHDELRDEMVDDTGKGIDIYHQNNPSLCQLSKHRTNRD